MKRCIFLATLFLVCTIVTLSAETVMVSYDLVLNVGKSSEDDSYIPQTSSDVEGAIMGDLFDRGHIVFNAPGRTYLMSPKTHELQTSIARKNRVAASAGADLFIYLTLYFDQRQKVYLDIMDYKIFRVGQSLLDQGDIQYPPLSRINGAEASAIFLDRIAPKDIFR